MHSFVACSIIRVCVCKKVELLLWKPKVVMYEQVKLSSLCCFINKWLSI